MRYGKYVAAALLACAMVGSAASAQSVLWDFGPSSGTDGGCWSNFTLGQNFAEQVVFSSDVNVSGINIYTCISAAGGDSHVKILADASGIPGGVVDEWDQPANNWVLDGDGIHYRAEFRFTDVPLQAGTYWIGVSGNGWEMGQTSVLTPGDGLMAQFNANVYGFMSTVGDQMFQVLGSTGGGGGYTLDLSGSCPGSVTVAWSGATPNHQQAIVFGQNTGSTVIPNGKPCAGTSLGIAGGVMQIGNFIGTGNGSGQINGNAGNSACGHYLQLVEGQTCNTSNVDQIP